MEGEGSLSNFYYRSKILSKYINGPKYIPADILNTYSGSGRILDMRGLDEVDVQILRFLHEDARRPYSEIAERVDVSQPTVTNRVERLCELGIIRGFTLDLDRSILHEGVSVLIDVDTFASSVDDVARAFEQQESIHTVYTTADSHAIVLATCRPNQVHELVAETISESQYSKYEVKLLANTSTDTSIHDVEFSVECAMCGNQVVSENGVATRIDGTLYHLCCERCEADFEEKYEMFRENA
ncbi:AsnC family transcriptional regulator (plasmid) [Natrinema zhouii]|uniref:AsnC family transcriptional regulator n=1 Tax=Natrinema zhouii TaxID=1710539 RepID=UPI001CFFE907|nr:AsnC family transcriptional regulator [Natrinema zhouii]UHQ99150.1 AsnC family transcriptional regulator [Natrinema zhouii]